MIRILPETAAQDTGPGRFNRTFRWCWRPDALDRARRHDLDGLLAALG